MPGVNLHHTFYNDCYCLTKTCHYEETIFILVVFNQ